MNRRSTHTYVVLNISKSAYDEIRAKLEAAGYQHAFYDDAIDMQGIALSVDYEAEAAKANGKARYAENPNPAIRLLHSISDTLPSRSIERDILVSATLYLEGEPGSGCTVERWVNAKRREIMRGASCS